jgi:hypothetical protein
MAKGKQASDNKQGRSNKSGADAGKSPPDPASNPAGTGNAQLAKSESESESAMGAAMAGMPQQPEAAGQSAIEALKQDHRRVEGLFSEFESATEGQAQAGAGGDDLRRAQHPHAFGGGDLLSGLPRGDG